MVVSTHSRLWVWCLGLGLVVAGCGDATPEEPLAEEIPNRNINFTILLDLSDRVLEPGQVDRDKELIKKIYDLFEHEVQLDVYINSMDKISVHAASQSSATYSSVQYEDSMFIDMARIGLADKKGGELKRKKAFFDSVDALYALAIADSSRGYSGADIWKWFKDDLVVDTTRQTFVFVLTDGYMNVLDRQEADLDTLTSIGRSRVGANVLVMEVDPSEEDYAYERLHNVWGRWFTSMGVQNYRVMKTEGLKATINQLMDFVSGPTPEKNIEFTETAPFNGRATGVNRQPGDIGYIMIADDRIQRGKEYAWRVASQSGAFSNQHKPDVGVGQELQILYKMNLRQELPPDNAEYYTTVGVSKILFRDDWVECLSDPVGIPRSRSTQYWVKVRFKRGVQMPITAEAPAPSTDAAPSNPENNTPVTRDPQMVQHPSKVDGATDVENLSLQVVSAPMSVRPGTCGINERPVILKVTTASGAPVPNCTITLGIKTPIQWISSPTLTQRPPGTWFVRTGADGTVALDLSPQKPFESNSVDLLFAISSSKPPASANTHIALCSTCQPCIP